MGNIYKSEVYVDYSIKYIKPSDAAKSLKIYDFGAEKLSKSMILTHAKFIEFSNALFFRLRFDAAKMKFSREIN
jgi:hypothetical protein